MKASFPASLPVRYFCQATFALISALAAGTSAYGQACAPGYPADPRDYDPREVAPLPAYCLYTQSFRDRPFGGKDPEKLKYWYSIMGEQIKDKGGMFDGMHHYCWGLMKLNRALTQPCTPAVRKYWLEQAIDEFNFVISLAPDDFVLLPEFLTKKGENLIRLGQTLPAMKELLRAIELKPDYWPPYASLSDFYKGTGDLRKAREFLEKGLSFSPDASALKRRLAELDSGKGTPKTAPESPKKSAAPKRPAQENAPPSAQKTETPQAPAGR